jgi:hypothetical protein
MFVGSQLGMVAATSVATISFASSVVSAADLTTYTFSAAALGTAATNRKIVVAICGAVSTTAIVSTLTVNGVTATFITGSRVRSPDNERPIELWQADVPTGATGDVVVTWSSAQNRCGIGVWAVYGAAAAPHATATDNSSPYSQNVVVPTGGVIIGASYGLTATSHAWTAPMVENYDQTVESTQMQSGSCYKSEAGETVTVIVTPNVVDQLVMTAVSFGPA